MSEVQAQVRLGLVAADPLRILGLQTVFEQSGSVEVVPLSVPGALQAESLGLVLIDAHCTDHLFELIASFRRSRPQTKLMVMGSNGNLDYVQKVIGAGAKAYLFETARADEIRMAIDVVRDGSVWAPRKVLARLIDAGAEQRQKRHSMEEVEFTPREREVLALLTTGRSNKEIARELGIEEVSVKAHVGRMMRKVGVTNRISLSVQVLASHVPIPAAAEEGKRGRR